MIFLFNVRVGQRGGAGSDLDGDGGRGDIVAVAIADYVVDAVLTRIGGVGGVEVGACLAVGEGYAAVGGIAGDLVGQFIALRVVSGDGARCGDSLIGLDIEGDSGGKGDGGGEDFVSFLVLSDAL